MIHRLPTSKILAASEYSKERAYWTEKLRNVDPTTLLPFDRTGTERRMQQQSFQLDPDLAQLIWNLCKGSNHKLHMVLHTAFLILLKKYLSKEDLVVGVPIYKQEHEGALLNTAVVVRNQVTTNMSFKDLLLQVRAALLEAIDNQNYPVDALAILHNLRVLPDSFPFFSSTLLLSNIHDEKYLDSIPAQMQFTFTNGRSAIECVVKYNAALYLSQTIHSYFKHFQEILRQCLTTPDIHIGAVQMLGQTELEELVALGRGETCYLPGGSLITLMREMAKSYPDKVAIRCGEEYFSYRQVDAWSDGLAAGLIQNHAVEKGHMIGICMDRSADMVISVLATLKAGAAFVPLDPHYPDKRLLHLATGSECRLILTDDKGKARLGESVATCLTAISEYYCADIRDVVFPHVEENDLAYVLYTSGSTGKPKGCEITHGSLMNYVYWANSAYDIAAQEGIALFSSLGFDFTLTSIFCPLSAGSAVRIFPDNSDVVAVLKEIFSADSGVTLVKLTPSHISIIDHLQVVPTKIGAVIAGGEKLSRSQIEILQKWNPDIKVFNEYGPTEATVGCVVAEVSQLNNEPIGKPISNTAICLLNDEGGPVPKGAAGEIYIGGAGLARQYLNEPELTVEKFIMLSAPVTGRFYKTGDIARWTSSGELEYLGRKDRQVKVNGNRIELQEIEHHLLDCKGIKVAAVQAKINDKGQTYLVAYFVADQETQTGLIREHLQTRLPDFMLPSFMVRLNALPLNAHGKVDYDALPDEKKLAGEMRKLVNPRNDVEKDLASIWSRVLNTEKIGIDDNFFEIGGNSLALITLHSELSKTYSTVSVPDLFKYNSIRSLHDYLASRHTVNTVRGIEV